jgi:tRNA(Ile)-lysidine synthase
VNAAKLEFPLEVRKVQTGDFFYPAGMFGKKKVSKYYKDEKYSHLDKESQWLLVTKNEIVWIIGKRADDRFTAKPTDKNIVKIEITE